MGGGGGTDATTVGARLALGRIAAGWMAAGPRRKTAKAKPLPEALVALLTRLTTEKPEERFGTAAALLEDLARAGRELPANSEAWDRLLRQVREHVPPETAFRESA